MVISISYRLTIPVILILGIIGYFAYQYYLQGVRDNFRYGVYLCGPKHAVIYTPYENIIVDETYGGQWEEGRNYMFPGDSVKGYMDNKWTNTVILKFHVSFADITPRYYEFDLRDLKLKSDRVGSNYPSFRQCGFLKSLS